MDVHGLIIQKGSKEHETKKTAEKKDLHNTQSWYSHKAVL